MSDVRDPSPAPTTPPAPTATPAPPRPGNGLAVAGFVLGLLGFLGSFIPVLNIVGIVLGVVGAVLAIVGLTKSKRTGTGKGLSIAGIVLGALALIIGVVVNLAFADVLGDALDEATDTTVIGSSATTDEASGTAVGASRDNPAPLGTAITGDDWTVTVNSVTTVDADRFGDTAQDGSVLLLVNLSATYDGDDEQGASPFVSVEYVTPDGTTIGSLDGSTVFVAENEFDSLGTVYAGGTVTGDEIIEVPADGWQDGVLAVSAGLLADDTFVAVQ